MSNERFLRLGQRCGNGLGMPSQGQNVCTDRQSPYPVSSPEEAQLVPEVTTGRARRSGVTGRSPALLFSFSQRNKKVPMPEDGHKQNRLCRARKEWWNQHTHSNGGLQRTFRIGFWNVIARVCVCDIEAV